MTRVPTAQGKQGQLPKIFCQGKLGEFENFAKIQGILYAQVVYCDICSKVLNFVLGK